MEISFPDEDCHRLFEAQSRLRTKFGNKLGELICRRISFLRAAESLALVPTSRPIDLRKEDEVTFSVALGPSFRLLFRAAGGCDPPPAKAVTSIEVLNVVEV